MFSKKWLAGVFALLLFAVPALAQTTTTETTLSAAVTTPSADTLVLTSATNVAAGRYLFIATGAGELVQVKSTYSSGTTIPIIRGKNGRAMPHLSGAKVIVGSTATPLLGTFIPASGIQTGGVTSGIFLNATPVGLCSTTAQQFTVTVNITNGDRTQCIGDMFSVIGGPNAQLKIVNCPLLTATIANVDSTCFVADRPYRVIAVTEVHNTIEDSAANVILSKDSTTDAPGAGVDLMTAGFDLTATTRVVQTGTLTTTASRLHLVSGDRLSTDTSAATDTVTGCVVTVTLVPE